MIRATQCSVALMIVLATHPAAVSSAEIVSTSFDGDIVSLDLTAAGTKDWAVFGVKQSSGPDGSLVAIDFKTGGTGIAKRLIVSGLTNAFGGDGMEGTQWTGGSWGWGDGTRRAGFIHHHGATTKAGMRIEFNESGHVGFEFAGPGEGKTNMAWLLLRRDQPIEIVAVQGRELESVHTNSGKSVGLAAVRYRGNEPLRIELRTEQKRAVARGFAVALSGAKDFPDEPGAIPTLQSLAMRKAEKLEDVDYLTIATNFADCMLKYGRDRYGDVHSPLFAILLTRENKPRIGPYPLFKSPSPYKTSNMKTAFRKFDYNCVLNYPGGLGGEGPHKVTFYGCDPYEDLKPRPLFWHFPNYIGATHVEPARPQSVIRDGDWKLFEFLEDGRLELYNLREDIAERNNLAARMPEKAKQLHEKLTAWREAAKVQMPRPNPKYLESPTDEKGTASRLKQRVEIAGKTFALDALPRQLSLVSDVGVVVPADLCRVQTIGPRFAHGTIYGPRAVKAPNGDYLVFGAGGGYYQRSEDKVNQAWMWRSTDQGKTWDEGIQPWSQNASEHCLVPMVDPATPKRIYVFGNASRSRTHAARMIFRYTDDNGCTWSKPRSIVPENDPKFPGAPIHMRGAVMPDGTWLWGAYYRIGSVGDTQYMLRSTDRGKTWSIAPDGHPKGWTHATWDKFMEGIVVPTGGNNATLYLRAPGGRMYEKRTDDSGLTWSETRDVPDLVHPDAPPMVFRLADGRRLIAFVHNRYDLKHPHHYHPDRVELWFATSEDQGRSWSEPRFVIGQAKHTDRPLSCDPDVSYVDLLVDRPALHLFVGDGQRQTVHVQFSQQDLDAFPTEATFGVDELSTKHAGETE